MIIIAKHLSIEKCFCKLLRAHPGAQAFLVVFVLSRHGTPMAYQLMILLFRL